VLDQLTQQRADLQHAAALGGVADHAAVDVQAADAGIRRAEHLMGDAGRNPYRAQRRRDEAATVGTHLEHPFHRMGQLHPGMAVAIAELEVGR